MSDGYHRVSAVGFCVQRQVGYLADLDASKPQISAGINALNAAETGP